MRPLYTLFILLLIATIPAHAAGRVWPLRDVTVILPYAINNEDDALYTVFAATFIGQSKRNLQIKYIPGRSGADAWGAMDVQNTDDGYTITSVTFPNLTMRARQASSGVDRKSMSICAVTSYVPVALWMPSKSPLANLAAFVAEARKKQSGLLVAGNGSFTSGQYAHAAFNRLAGIQTTYLPQMSTMTAAKMIRNGEATGLWTDAVALPSLLDDFRPVAIAAENRSSAFPDTPTFAELGYPLVYGTFRGIAVPNTTDPEMQTTLTEYFLKINTTTAFQTTAQKLGFSIMDIHGDALKGFLTPLEAQYVEKAEELGLSQP